MFAFSVTSAQAQIVWPPPICEMIVKPDSTSTVFVSNYLSSFSEGAVRVCTGNFRGTGNETIYDALSPITKNGAVCGYERIGQAHPIEGAEPVTEFVLFEGSELPSYRAYAEGTCPNWESEEFVEVIGTSDERFAEMIPFWRAVVSNAEAFDNHIADVPQSSLLQDFRALVRTEPQRATKIISIMRIPIWGIWGAFDIQVEDPRDPAQDFGFLLRRGLLGWRIVDMGIVYY